MFLHLFEAGKKELSVFASTFFKGLVRSLKVSWRNHITVQALEKLDPSVMNVLLLKTFKLNPTSQKMVNDHEYCTIMIIY